MAYASRTLDATQFGGTGQNACNPPAILVDIGRESLNNHSCVAHHGAGCGRSRVREGKASMRAMVIGRFGGPEVFEERDMPRPVVGPTQLLVKVVATAVNPVDYKIRQAGAW